MAALRMHGWKGLNPAQEPVQALDRILPTRQPQPGEGVKREMKKK